MVSPPRRTPLHDRHVALGAKLGGFAGWDMPLEYTTVREEHRAVRGRAGVFDVSHMGQIEVTGAEAGDYLNRTLTNDIGKLHPGAGQYTLVCREDGGTIDDLIVYRLGADRYLIICNASNVAPVHEWIAGRAPAGAGVANRSDEYAMLAVQGPEWQAATAPLGGGEGLAGLAYFDIAPVTLAGVECLVARTGYTGEPGVEILCPSERATGIWDTMQAGSAAPVPAGLAARDTLRMEMGYPLYGQELTLERSPIEAGLKWACDLEGEFTGADVMRRQAAEGTAERLCSFVLTEPGIPRTGCPVVDGDAVIGSVTSGTLSPTLDIGIGMAYVPAALAGPGNPLEIDIRGKRKAAETRKRPLVDTSPRRSD
jgi:aminomethyltransferase